MSVNNQMFQLVALYQLPPAIPQGMLYRVKQIIGVSKKNFKNCSFIRSNDHYHRPKGNSIFTP